MKVNNEWKLIYLYLKNIYLVIWSMEQFCEKNGTLENLCSLELEIYQNSSFQIILFLLCHVILKFTTNKIIYINIYIYIYINIKFLFVINSTLSLYRWSCIFWKLLFFVYGIRKYFSFILLQVVDQFSQHHLLKRLSFFHCISLPP